MQSSRLGTIRSVIKTVFFDFLVQRISVHAKPSGGFGLNAAAQFKDLRNQFTFNVINDATMDIGRFPPGLAEAQLDECLGLRREVARRGGLRGLDHRRASARHAFW